MISGGWECVHAALPVLRRVLLRGKVRQVLNIVRGKSVFTNGVYAIRTVHLSANIIAKTKHCIRVLSVCPDSRQQKKGLAQSKSDSILLSPELTVQRLG